MDAIAIFNSRLSVTYLCSASTRYWLIFAVDRLRNRGHSTFYIHPCIQQTLSKPPPIPELERRNEALRRISIQRIAANAQIIRRLAYVHHFTQNYMFLSSSGH